MECPDLLGTWHSCPPLVPGLTLDERALFGDLAVPLVLLLAVTLLALATAAGFAAASPGCTACCAQAPKTSVKVSERRRKRFIYGTGKECGASWSE